jgi:hypothetical protein
MKTGCNDVPSGDCATSKLRVIVAGAGGAGQTMKKTTFVFFIAGVTLVAAL